MRSATGDLTGEDGQSSASGPAPHTLFQVSTSGALVAGLYQGVVSAGVVLQHGDFGLGTFADLDGEMVVVDGKVFQAKGDGSVREVDASACAPFAVVTRFEPDIDAELEAASSLKELEARCDALRSSNNIFYAVRLDGVFSSMKVRAVTTPPDNSRLVDAAKMQSEFELGTTRGTLVGLWSPGFSSAFSVPGYHFHFLSDERDHGGHLLACSTQRLRVRIERLTDFHLILPSNEAYLKADLSKNSADELAYAEQSH
jgi:acetolactate decarboxylase